MKKFIIIVFALLCQFVSSQNSVDLKLTYKPEKEYLISLVMKSNNEIKYSGSKEILEELEAEGIQNPTNTNSNLSLNSSFTTGKLKNGEFPVIIKYGKSEDHEGKEIIPLGTTIYGNCKLDGLPKLDSIVSKNMNEELKKNLFALVNNTFSKIILPNQTIKIGETITLTNPLSMPIANTNVDMIITTNYKLISIKDNIGYFDITNDIKMTTTINDQNISASGSGIGKLIYDINENFYTDMETNYGIKMKIEVENITLNLTSNSYQKITNIIK